ncbi:MAG: MarR family winged helix-turn-helix transcriptional regulator [Enterococcus sp.]
MEQTFFEQISDINRAIHRINSLYSKWAQEHATNQNTISIMHMLVTEGQITQKKFIEAHNVPKQSVNNIILSLKKDQLIEMKSSEVDKREKVIVLTEKGKSYSEQLLSPLFALEKQVVNEMGTESMRELMDSTTKFGDMLEKVMKTEGKE